MANRSCHGHFILLGFSDRPDLERPLFVFVLISYLAALVGNLLIVLVSRLDSRLHTPMYFFLTNLSLLDLGFTSSAIPRLLVHLRGRARAISWAGCAAQLFLFLALGGAECVLLAAMAYDRFCAVCRPLRYALLLRPARRGGLVAAAWAVGLLNSLAMSPVTLRLPRCGRCEVRHFLCEMPALIRTACVDTAAVEAAVFVLSVAIVLAPLSLILASYGHIARAVLRLGSAGRAKALHTCGAHLAVVALFYGNIVCTYMQPGGAGAQGRFLTLGYSLVTPALNPVIYTLRNKDVKGALRKLVASTRGDQALS